MDEIIVLGIVVISGFAITLLRRVFHNGDDRSHDFGWRFPRGSGTVTGLGARSPSDAKAAAESWVDFETEV